MLQRSEVQDDPSVQLRIIIVGAGIAGFAVAAALRQAGHQITIIEKSSFTKEAGFSISVAPNGAKVLNALGFDFSRAGAVTCNAIVDRDSKTLEPRINFSTRDAVKRWGAPWTMMLRPDIHNELKRVALQDDGRTPVPELILGARVTSVDIDLATVILADGTVYSGDLIIGADGERSLIQRAVVDQPGVLRGSPVSIFRNIVPTEVMMADPITRRIMESRRNTFTMFSNRNSYTILTWFECRNGTLQDLEASYVNILPDGTKKIFDKTKLKDAMLHEFRDFHPDLIHTLKKVTEATDWQINFARPLSNWVKGRAALVGDAAHSMFPTTGQGGCQSIEDAGALGVLLSDIRHKDELLDRLRLYESVRRQRASTSQAMSSTVFGREHEVPQRMHKYLPGGMPFQSAEQYQEYTNSYDVMAECRRALRHVQRSQTRSRL